MDANQLAHLNKTLENLAMELNRNTNLLGEAIAAANKVASTNYTITLAVLRALCEMNPQFRLVLLRVADEPTGDPEMRAALEELKKAVAQTHRAAGSRAPLKPVPTDPK